MLRYDGDTMDAGGGYDDEPADDMGVLAQEELAVEAALSAWEVFLRRFDLEKEHSAQLSDIARLARQAGEAFAREMMEPTNP